MFVQLPSKLTGKKEPRVCIAHEVGGMYGSSFGTFNAGNSEIFIMSTWRRVFEKFLHINVYAKFFSNWWDKHMCTEMSFKSTGVRHGSKKNVWCWTKKRK